MHCMYSFFREWLLVTPLSPKIQAMKILLEYYPVTSGQNQIQYEISCNRNINYKEQQQKTPTSLSIICDVALSVFNCVSHKQR